MYRYFENEIEEVKSDIIKMTVLTRKMIQESYDALKEKDVEKAKKIIESDEEVDRLEIIIEDKCTEIILRHHPLAKDLRFVLSAIKMANELERIADLGVNICQRVIEISDRNFFMPLDDIKTMFDIVNNVLFDCLKSFNEKDYELAKKIIIRDEEIDILKNKIYLSIVERYIKKDIQNADAWISLIFVAKHLERIGDHCVNIAEDIIYMISSKTVKHHNEEF
ncbi:MAG: phosphate signaling complex protein PhoU [Elusimicrobiota bacterium]